MKYIKKSSVEPLSLSDWKSQSKMFKNGTAKWHKFSKGKDGREYKKEFTQDLIIEQGYICCYCEQKLKIENCHIEHLLPQSKDVYSKYIFDHQNLLCSCQLELEEGEPRHCGNSKSDNILLITPLMPECENKFIYTEDGHILPASLSKQIKWFSEDNRLLSLKDFQYQWNEFCMIFNTIKYLQLGIDKLNDLRRNAIEPFISEEISQEEANIFAKQYLQNNNGKYKEFYTTIKYLYG